MPNSNASLKAVLDKYVSLTQICEYAQELASNKASCAKFIQKFQLPFVGEKVKHQSHIHVKEYFDEKLLQSILDYVFLDIVATFERMFFLKVDNASGEIRQIVKDYYLAPAPLSDISRGFIKNKDDISSIAGIEKLLDGKIPQRLSGKLSIIREHRNWIAHGKRSIGKPSTMTVQEVHDILQEIWSII